MKRKQPPSLPLVQIMAVVLPVTGRKGSSAWRGAGSHCNEGFERNLTALTWLVWVLPLEFKPQKEP